ESQSEIPRSVLDAKQVPRHVSGRCQDDDARRMRELLRPRVPDVPESSRLRESIDRALRRREEMRCAASPLVLVPREKLRLLFSRWCRRVARIETDDDNVEIASGLERQHVDRARETADDLRAQHGAAVVREHEHDRTPAEVAADWPGEAPLVDDLDVE